MRRFISSIIKGRGFFGKIADLIRYPISSTDIPDIPSTFEDAGQKKVLIGPNNAAGQAYQWAKALNQNLPGTRALSVNGIDASVYKAAVDIEVKPAIFLRSTEWHEIFQALLLNQDHVIYESLIPLLGRKFRMDTETEINFLRDNGVHVSAIFHGSDIRVPSINTSYNKWSPFPRMGAKSKFLEEQTSGNLSLVDRLNVQAAVSTPDLLRYLPSAIWVPTVVDYAQWNNQSEILVDKIPKVLHLPTNRLLKGTDLIEPILIGMAEDGLIDYRSVTGLNPNEVGQLIQESDIVLDQFVIDGYGVVALEAMASGKIVLGNCSPDTRLHVEKITGRVLPVVQATPGDIGDVLLQVLQQRARHRDLALEGRQFVAQIHDGAFSAAQLTALIGA